MTVTHLILSLLLGLAANVLAELFLVFDLRQPLHQLDSVHKRLRLVRWLAGFAGLLIAASFDPPFPTLILFTLFSVSASTDLETKLLPPDWYVFGSVIAALAFALASGGWGTFRDVAVAQAFCFAIVTFGVAFLKLCDSGDIKLAMQFGAACGSLTAVAVGAVGIWLAAIITVAAAMCGYALHLPVLQAFRRGTQIQPLQGPLMWCGLLMAMWWTAAGGTTV